MSLAPTDQRDLVEPLFSGLLEAPPWRTFLRRLIARTGAERAGLTLWGPGGAFLDLKGEAFAVARAVCQARQLLGDRTLPPGLRPFRVYTYAELVEAEPSSQRASAAGQLAAARIAFGRLVRVPAEPGWEAALVLEHSARDFTAADSALLSSLGPFVATAVALLRELENLRHRAAIAEDALAAAGVSQALLDRERRVMAVDAGHLGDHAVQAGTPFLLSGPRSAELARAAAEVGSGTATSALVRDPAQPQRDLLLRPSPPSSALVTLPGSVIAVTRGVPRASAQAMAAVLTARHGLSRREAELAVALAAGEELVPAGRRLGLTPESTRNYSKRIYAKTGTRGQADLVRLVLSGLAPFATA